MMRSILWTTLGILLGAGGYALAQHSAGAGHGRKSKTLMEQVLAGKLDGKDVQMTVLDLQSGPGAASPPHRHPGQVFVYVLDGELESQVDGQPLKTYRKGEMFYEPPGGVHRVSRNPSKTQPNRFLAFMIVPKGEKKLAIPVDGNEPPPPAAAPEGDELARLYREDQDDRKGGNIDWEKVGPRDQQREARVRELYKADKLHTGADYYHAAMILQHGRRPDDYLLAHEFCVAAIGKGEERAKWLAAASEDRFLQSIQRPQRFGTQYGVEASSGAWRVKPPVAPDVTDGLRRALNVPTLQEAEANAARFQKMFQKAKKP
jgi:quercetin dioxygenase-like cupin family protein